MATGWQTLNSRTLLRWCRLGGLPPLTNTARAAATASQALLDLNNDSSMRR